MRWPKCGIRLESTGIRLEFGGSIHSTCLHASIIKVNNPQRPLVNILSIFGGENSLRKKGVGGKRENLEEGEIASSRRERRVRGTYSARARTYHHPSHCRAHPSRLPPICPLLTISSLSVDSFLPERAFTLQKSMKNLGGAEIG